MVRVPGEHAPNIKNRSSKHLICLTKHRPYIRCVNNELLDKLAGTPGAAKEARRRANKRAKKDAK